MGNKWHYNRIKNKQVDTSPDSYQFEVIKTKWLKDVSRQQHEVLLFHKVVKLKDTSYIRTIKSTQLNKRKEPCPVLQTEPENIYWLLNLGQLSYVRTEVGLSYTPRKRRNIVI